MSLQNSFAFWLTPMVAGALLLGCSPAAPAAAPSSGQAVGEEKPTYGGAFRRAQSADPPTLDPHLSTTGSVTGQAKLVYNRLTQYAYGAGPETLKIVGDLAERWEQPNDRTYVFYLRKGVKWHNLPPTNGRELTAEDVKYSLERLADPKSKSVGVEQFGTIASIETPDLYTVKITLKEPNAAFLSIVTWPESAFILPKDALVQFGDMAKNMIGTGPFILESYERNVKVVHKKNPQYFVKDLPYLDKVETLIIPDESARQAAFLSKQSDVTSVPFRDLDAIKQAVPGVQVLSLSGNTTTRSYFMVVSKPPLNDLKVRQAMNYAIDKKRMGDVMDQGQSDVLGIVPLGDWSLPKDELLQLYRYDLPLARKLLAESGYPNGFKTTLMTFIQYGQRDVDQAQMIIEDLKKINIEATLAPVELAAGRKKWFDHDFDTYVGVRVTALDPDFFTWAGYHPKGDKNYMAFSDPKMTDLVNKQRTTMNTEERKKIVWEVQRYAAEMAAEIALPVQRSFTLLQPGVKNYQESIDSDMPKEPYIWLQK